jgi:PAS domain S-box-containing protein
LTLRYQQCVLKRRAEKLQDKLELSNRLHKVALKESKEKLRLVMNVIPAMISATDATHDYVFMNNFQAWMLGLNPEDIVGKSAEEFMGEVYALRNRKLDRQVFESGVSIPAFEEEFFDATGRRRILLTTKSPLRDSTGAVANVVSASVDISDRKAAELALEDQRSFLRDVIDHDPNIIFATDHNGALTLVNKAMVKFCGVPPEHLIGRAFVGAAPIRAEAELLHKDMEQVLAGGESKLLRERRLTDGAGEARWYQTVSIAIEQGGDNRAAVLTVGTDISALKKEPAEMNTAEPAAVSSDFAAHVGEELRTPLNAIMRYCELIGAPMSGGDGRPSAGEMAADIGANARHLLGLVDDFVDVSNYHAGKYTLSNQELDVEATIREVAGQLAPQCGSRRLRLGIDIADNLPALIADPVRLRQGLLNLLANAVEMTPPGGSVSIGARLNENGALRISLRDHNRAEHGLGRSRPGSELDLPLAAAFMKMHDADFDISRRDGEATRITVTFPAIRSAWRQVATTQ